MEAMFTRSSEAVPLVIFWQSWMVAVILVVSIFSSAHTSTWLINHLFIYLLGFDLPQDDCSLFAVIVVRRSG